jgi:hypothetical protein
MDDARLSSYLSDHLAGSAGGASVARRCLARSRGSEVGDYLERFLDEVEFERARLRATIDRLAAPTGLAKRVAGLVGTWAGLIQELAPTAYTELDRMRDLEVLCVGVRAKQLLWEALDQVAGDGDRLDDLELDRLREMAKDQAAVLQRLRRKAIRPAFEATPTAATA